MDPGNGSQSQTAFAQSGEPVIVGEVSFWEASRALTVRGQPVKLPWRVVECFALLVEARGAVVSRQTMEEHIWGKSIIDESSLAKCVATLRKALDPAAHGGSYVETVSRIGYRLTVPIGAAAHAAEPEAATPSPAARQSRPFRRRYYVIAAALAAVLAVAAFRVNANVQTHQRAEALTEEGLTLLRRSGPANGAKAVELFQQAVELQPDFALPYAALAESSARFGKYSFESASALARKSLELDPACRECQAIWGYILMTREWRWTEAGRLLERSVHGSSPKAQWQVWYSMWLSLHGRFEEAIAQAASALDAKPTMATAYTTRAMAHYLAGHYKEAIIDSERALVANPSSQPAYYWMGRAHMMLGNDVNVVIDRAYELAAWSDWQAETRNEYSMRYESLVAARGRKALAQAWIDEVGHGAPREVNRYNRAVWFAWAGAYDSALEELEAALVSRPYWLILAPVDPVFAPVRQNPRFQAVLQKLERPAPSESLQSRR